MKILIVRMWPDVLNINGYNSQEIGLAKALIRKGNTCDIVLYTDGLERTEELAFDENTYKMKIYHLKARKFFKNAFFGKKLYEICKEYDVIQTAEYDQIANVKLFQKYGNKVVIFHGPYQSKYTRGYNKKILLSDLYYLFHPNYKSLNVISKSELATSFLKSKGFDKVTTIGVGLDDDRFKGNKRVTNEKIMKLAEMKKEQELVYFLYVGKIEDRRNTMFLIDRLKFAVNNQNNVRLIMVGKGDKKYKEQVFNYAKQLGVFQNIIYYESFLQIELPNLYEICDLFLLPSQYEIFGMVMLEAMYFGLPLITTINGGSSVLIEDGINGYVCDLKDIKKWNDSILNVIKKINSELSTNAQNKIKNEFVWDRLVDKYIEVYNKCR